MIKIQDFVLFYEWDNANDGKDRLHFSTHFILKYSENRKK